MLPGMSLNHAFRTLVMYFYLLHWMLIDLDHPSVGHSGNPYYADVESSYSLVIGSIIINKKACDVFASVEVSTREYREIICSLVAVGIGISLVCYRVKKLY